MYAPFAQYKPSSNRPGYKACAKMVAGDAQKALRVARHVKSLLNVEKKNHDVSVTAVGVPDGVGTIFQLTNIPQGDTTISRDGSNVKIISIYIKILMILDASATTGSSFRVILVHDKQTNQAIYTTAELLSTVVNGSSLVSPLNLDNQFRFRILHDKCYTLSDGGSKHKFVKIFKKVNTRLRFDASTPSIADLRSSSYSLVLIGNETTNEPNVRFEARLRFVDN